eukprot:Hpha_TRINITY_DN10727_c0_g2::TRINITY_DN10727_c0_g2_i1::g.43763::m.43763
MELFSPRQAGNQESRFVKKQFSRLASIAETHQDAPHRRRSSVSVLGAESVDALIRSAQSAAGALVAALVVLVCPKRRTSKHDPPDVIVVDSTERPQCDGIYVERLRKGERFWVSAQGQHLFRSSRGRWLISDSAADVTDDVGWLRSGADAARPPHLQERWEVMEGEAWCDAGGTEVMELEDAAAMSQRDWETVCEALIARHGTMRAAHANINSGRTTAGNLQANGMLTLEEFRDALRVLEIDHLACPAMLRVCSNLRGCSLDDFLAFSKPEMPAVVFDPATCRLKAERRASKAKENARRVSLRKETRDMLTHPEGALKLAADGMTPDWGDVRRRGELLQEPLVKAAVWEWWRRVPKTPEAGVDFRRYQWLCRRLHAALVGPETADFNQTLHADWDVDREGAGVLDQRSFCRCVAEMAAVWCSDASTAVCVEFLDTLREEVLPLRVSFGNVLRGREQSVSDITPLRAYLNTPRCPSCQAALLPFGRERVCKCCGARMCSACVQRSGEGYCAACAPSVQKRRGLGPRGTEAVLSPPMKGKRGSFNSRRGSQNSRRGSQSSRRGSERGSQSLSSFSPISAQSPKSITITYSAPTDAAGCAPELRRIEQSEVTGICISPVPAASPMAHVPASVEAADALRNGLASDADPIEWKSDPEPVEWRLPWNDVGSPTKVEELDITERAADAAGAQMVEVGEGVAQEVPPSVEFEDW